MLSERSQRLRFAGVEAWAEEDDQIRRPPESIYYLYYIHASIEICPCMYIFVVGPDHHIGTDSHTTASENLQTHEIGIQE